MSSKGDRVLCVAADPERRARLADPLEAHVTVLRAATGNEALAAIRANRPVLAALVDAELKGTGGGAQLLAYVRIAAPETARVLVARAIDAEVAATAVNEAEVARILLEPFTPAQLLLALDAVQGARRDAAARAPIEGRRSCTRLLDRLLARAVPHAHARAKRVHKLLMGLRDDSRIDGGILEAAALCAEVATLALPPALLERALVGEPLAEDEAQAREALTRARGELLAGVPELQRAHEIAERAARRFAEDTSAPAEARALRIALDFDALAQSGLPDALALDTLHGRAGAYDPELLESFGRGLGAERSGSSVRELPVKQVGSGMVFAEDVRTRSGSLLIARGRAATPSIVRHIRQFPPGQVLEPVRVIVPAPENP